MANLKEVRGRITSVGSTQQITKAMKMVAASKLKRAQDAIMLMRPYATKLEEILSNVSGTLDAESNNVYGESRDKVKRVLYIVVTSDKGLCGGFNTNLMKEVLPHMEENYSEQAAKNNVDILAIGKKGAEFFERQDIRTRRDFVDILGKITFEKAMEAAEFAMERFEKGTYDRVELAYNEFKNAAIQIPSVQQFLPIVPTESTEGVSSTNADYLFEPSKEFIVQELIPKALKLQVFKACLESNAAENGARMTAMDKATENAGEMLKDLKLVYNRTRQAAITTEILEIVAGAEALAG